ncbi:SDR family NAD(P)-dependent oxidoreductase [Viridibacillus sp. NPDC093762]|uniref:SDR family NAD(P)-dependent oxidoreductase n=1 Tax=Viridibacillus sp. NPDC093762 TaxID=3390720 RepID=UPI003D085D7F
MDFKEKVVVITGAAGGIGQATARLFAQKGAKLVLVDLNSQGLKNMVSNLNLAEEDYLILPTDVSKEEQVQNYVEKGMEKFGKIDVFFNNAGIGGKTGLLIQQSAHDLDNVLNVNVKGVFYGMKHILKVMVEQKSGSIINTASVAGLVGTPGLAIYTASKHAVIGLTKAAALENSRNGVRVNAVCPAPVDTDMVRELEEWIAPGKTREEQKSIFAKSVPMKRYSSPDEIAQLVVFLASENASYITGSAYTIDGGMTAG